MSSIITRLADKAEWEAFYTKKLAAGNMTRYEADDLERFISGEEYLPTVRRILNGDTLSPPQKVLLGKAKTDKKRTVYVYCREENYVLKLIASLLFEYDGVFSPCLYSFRKNSGVRRATQDILKNGDICSYYSYKLDVSDYFNSIPVSRLLPMVKNVLKNDERLYGFIRSVLEFPYAIYDGEPDASDRGVMAGVPISGFLANLYLSELDGHFHALGVRYARYSDDIIVFAKSERELAEHKAYILSFIDKMGLRVNPKKEFTSAPNETWTFLGFSHCNGTVDVSRASVDKLKGKMRRKSRALVRWASRKGVDGKKAAQVLIRCFNKKLFEDPRGGELTWARWYFPVITTSASLQELDRYMQDCIRYTATGKRNKSRFSFTYEDMKACGYKSLVAEYYDHK